MLPILTPQESAALDAASLERGITVEALMESAGRAVAQAAAGVAEGAYGMRAVVLCGTGNNGGDALVAARYLERWGMGVTVLLLAGPDAFRGAAAANFGRFVDVGGRWHRSSAARLDRELARADVAVDGIFGTGFHGTPEGDAAAAIEVLNASAVPAVAVDIPSGVEGATGAVATLAVIADRTVTFGALKPGLVFYPGAEFAGDVEVADIGFPEGSVRSDLGLVQREDLAALLVPRGAESHKREAGYVLVLAGSRAMTGAAILAATSAYRAGAGLVTVAVPQGILRVVQGAITEATFLPLPETGEGSVSEEAWPVLRERLDGVGAVAVGPGLSTNEETSAMVRRLVAESPVPLVLDADGLNAFAGRALGLADRSSPMVITPHAGEFGRLTGLDPKAVVADRVGHARMAASDFRCTVLLKGSRTVVAEPDGRAWVNPTGGPYLATGGTGDVLTGAIAAFLARGLEAPDAAKLGAFVHGLAGSMAAGELGDGTTAGDVLAMLPEAIGRVRDRTPG